MRRPTDPLPENDVPTPDRSSSRSLGRVVAILGSVVFGVFYLMLAAGGASFVNECDTVICAQLQQAIFAAVGSVALFVAAYKVSEGQSSATKVAFFGTLPILVVHVVLVLEDPNEAIFFPLSTTPPPAISGAALFLQRPTR